MAIGEYFWQPVGFDEVGCSCMIGKSSAKHDQSLPIIFMALAGSR